MPKFVAGDDVYVGGVKLSSDLVIGATTAPVMGTLQQEATNKIFRFVYSKPVFKYVVVEATFKAAFTLATNGTTFAALAAADTVSIDGKIVTVTFNVALAGATNKIKIGAAALQDIFGNVNALYTTSTITLL